MEWITERKLITSTTVGQVNEMAAMKRASPETLFKYRAQNKGQSMDKLCLAKMTIFPAKVWLVSHFEWTC